MNYEDYKKMTPEQKEEFDWRFRGRYDEFPMHYWDLLLVQFTTVFTLMTFALAYSMPTMEKYKESLTMLFDNTIQFTQVWMYVFFLSIVVNIIIFAEFHYRKRQFLKKVKTGVRSTCK